MLNIKLNPILTIINKHDRDKNIKFFESGHRYQILTDIKSHYTSVTTWCHTNFPKFDADAIIDSMMKSKNWNSEHKYWGMTKEQIKESWNKNRDNVANAGTDLHYQIECFMNNNQLKFKYTHKELYTEYNIKLREKYIIEDDSFIEWKYFINFVKDHPKLTPYRTEWMIYHEEAKLSGSIDMVYENEDGTLSIYDWKRCKEITKSNSWNKYATNKLICQIPDTNFWHYSLQLNTYKKILEDKYGKTVKDLYLVKLHPNNEENNYELYKVPIMTQEMNELFEQRIKKLNPLREYFSKKT